MKAHSPSMAVLRFLIELAKGVRNKHMPKTKINNKAQWPGIVWLWICFLVLSVPSQLGAQTFHSLDSHFYGSSCSDLICPGASCYTPGECPNYCKCSTTPACIHSSGIVCDHSASSQPLGNVDVGACSDYGRLSAGLTVQHNIGANGFSCGTSARFLDQ